MTHTDIEQTQTYSYLTNLLSAWFWAEINAINCQLWRTHSFLLAYFLTRIFSCFRIFYSHFFTRIFSCTFYICKNLLDTVYILYWRRNLDIKLSKASSDQQQNYGKLPTTTTTYKFNVRLGAPTATASI